MGRPLFVRQWIAAIVSLFLILSLPLEALGASYGASAYPAAAASPAGDAGGVAVLQIGDGALLALAEVSESEEPSVVARLAEIDPSHLTLGVTGPKDPAYQLAAKIDQRSRFKSFTVAKWQEIPFFKRPQVPKSLGSAIVQKINKFVETRVDKKVRKGLLGALIYAGAMGGVSTFYFSAGVDNGLKVFGGILMAYSFIVTNSHGWEKILDAPGNAVEALIVKVFGELSESSSRTLKIAGVFASSWVVNTLINAFVFDMSGHLESIGQAAYYGFLGNYAILDASVVKKVKRGEMSEDAKSNYYLGQMLIGTALEVLGIMHVPGIQATLGILTLSAFLYLVAGDERVDRVVYPKVRGVVRRARAYEKLRSRPFSAVSYSFGSMFKNCQTQLVSTRGLNHIRAAEDLW